MDQASKMKGKTLSKAWVGRIVRVALQVRRVVKWNRKLLWETSELTNMQLAPPCRYRKIYHSGRRVCAIDMGKSQRLPIWHGSRSCTCFLPHTLNPAHPIHSRRQGRAGVDSITQHSAVFRDISQSHIPLLIDWIRPHAAWANCSAPLTPSTPGSWLVKASKSAVEFIVLQLRNSNIGRLRVPFVAIGYS